MHILFFHIQERERSREKAYIIFRDQSQRSRDPNIEQADELRGDQFQGARFDRRERETR